MRCCSKFNLCCSGISVACLHFHYSVPRLLHACVLPLALLPVTSAANCVPIRIGSRLSTGTTATQAQKGPPYSHSTQHLPCAPCSCLYHQSQSRPRPLPPDLSIRGSTHTSLPTTELGPRGVNVAPVSVVALTSIDQYQQPSHSNTGPGQGQFCSRQVTHRLSSRASVRGRRLKRPNLQAQAPLLCSTTPPPEPSPERDIEHHSCPVPLAAGCSSPQTPDTLCCTATVLLFPYFAACLSARFMISLALRVLL